MDEYRTEEEFIKDNGYEISGVWYPRVTKIIGIKAKPALYRFYAKLGNFNAGREITEKSAEEGTRVHEAVQAVMVGMEPVLDEITGPAVEAYRQFIADTPISTNPEYIERRVVSGEHRYAGTADALATINGKFGVLDIKTSAAIYRDYNLQTAAYAHVLASEFEHIETRWILRIDQSQTCMVCRATRRLKGGRENIKPASWGGNRPPYHQHEWSYPKGIVELREFPHWLDDFEAFLGAKKLWEWENQDWLKKIGYLN